MQRCDLAVIGTGPGGHFGAIQAAKLGKKVVAIEMDDSPGGAAAITGTIPSKSLREATLHLTGHRQRAHYGSHYRVKHDLTIDDLTQSTGKIVQHESNVLRDQLRRNGVELIFGAASFVGSHELEIHRGRDIYSLEADNVLIAVGSRPAHPPELDFDGRHLIDSNQILKLKSIPRQLIVVGAGVIGCEYACIFAALGSRVILINESDSYLEFIDRQVRDALAHHMQSGGVEFRFGERVVGLERNNGGVIASTESGKKIAGECLLYSVGRQGNTDSLNLDAADLTADKRGRLHVNENYQTDVPHIYAAGDVIGFPALAATSREQGRAAAKSMFGIEADDATVSPTAPTPYGVYTIPEISMVGPTEQELTEKGVPYEIGVARHREIARGQILGDETGLLKLLFHRETRVLLAVHVIGEGATEMVHIGQAAIAFGATIDYFTETVFNYPTLAECYKVAALDGANRLRMLGGSAMKLAA
jgi:NAD(P) transhydrogenase